MFLFAESVEYIFRVSPMICQRVSVPVTFVPVRYFHDKISLVFVVFFHFFMGFFVFSLCLFKFSRVVQSNSSLAKTATNAFLNFIVLLCPFSFCSQSVFPLYFHAVFPALYNNLCTKTTLNVVTLVSHSRKQETKRQRALWCYNARSVTNHVADFLLLIL